MNIRNSYGHLRRLAANNCEIVAAALTDDARAFLSSGPTVAEMADYSCTLEDIAVVFELVAAEIRDHRKAVNRRFVDEMETIAARLDAEGA